MNRRRAMTRDASTGDTIARHRVEREGTKKREKKKERVVDMSTRAWIVGVDASPASVRAVRWFADTIGRAGDPRVWCTSFRGAMRCDAMGSVIGDR